MATNKLLVGYFPGWSIHTQNYHVSDIPADKLTHVNYTSAEVSNNGECVSINPQDDQINFPALQLLKQQQPNLRILISVGGASHSSNFSKATKTAPARQSLAQSCVRFMKVSGFDGIDTDWEFPSSTDKSNYTAFLKELRSQLDAQGASDGKHYLLTAALPARPDNYDNLELDQIHQYLDWINLMAYDFYTASSSPTHFSAPLYTSSSDPEPDQKKRSSYNVDAAIRTYLSQGVPPGKIVVGVPFIGYGWEGVSNVNNGLYQSASGPAQGTWQKDGIFDFKDLSSNYVRTYLRFWNAEVSAPWLYNPNTGIMISYDDAQSLGLKAGYVNANNLGGVMIWQLSADDQSSLVNALAASLNPAPVTTPDSFKGILPYATELLGVYQPLVGWIGNLGGSRLKREMTRNSPSPGRPPLSRARAIPTAEVPSPTAEAPGIPGLLSFPDPFISTLMSATVGNVGVLSPVGLLQLYREYFFEFDSFLGPPVGHVWLSPGGTVELIESSTRKTTVERTTEVSTETSRTTEEGLTQQDDLADAVKEDNLNNTKFGVTESGGVSVGIVHGDASASFSVDNTVHTSQEETHKQTRTQSEKVSSQIRRNFKTTLRTVTETTDTSSRRYVVQNTTDQLVNYELRRKMRKVAVQLQHLGMRLCWQVYLDNPGNLLGLGEMVHTVTASANGMKPPDPLAPQEKQITVQFPLKPSVAPGVDTGNSSGFGSGRVTQSYLWYGPDQDPPPQPAIPPQSLRDYDNKYFIHGCCFYDATPPGAGYTLSAVRINKSDVDSVWAVTYVDDQFAGSFHIQLIWVYWQSKGSINFDLTLVWDPPDPDPAMVDYQKQLATAQKIDYANVVRNRLKLASGIKARPADDLRAEERDTVYGSLIQQLMMGPDRHVSSELLREIFDVDQMIYFVAPDFWRPRTLVPPNIAPKYEPKPPPDVDPTRPLDLIGEMVLSWYGHTDANLNIQSDGTVATVFRNNYLITEETQPAPKGSSLGWLIQLDGDARRNEFLNASWVQAAFPVRPGHELEALAWLRAANVEGESGLSQPYRMQPGDPPAYQGLTIGQVLILLAEELAALNTDMNNTLATEEVFEYGFDPLQGGFKFTGPYEIFDQWIEVLPTDQVVAVAVEYDPKTGKQK